MKARKEAERVNGDLMLDVNAIKEKFMQEAMRNSEEEERRREEEEQLVRDEEARKMETSQVVDALRVEVQQEVQKRQQAEAKVSQVEARNRQLELGIESLQKFVKEEEMKRNHLLEELKQARNAIEHLKREAAELTGDVADPNLEAKYMKLKREQKKNLKDLEDTKEKLRSEMRKKDEILQVKVRLEEKLEVAKKKIERLQNKTQVTAAVSKLSQSGLGSPFKVLAHFSLSLSLFLLLLQHKQDRKKETNKSTNQLIRHQKKQGSFSPSRFRGASKEDLHIYIEELLAKVEEDTLRILQLEQENSEIRAKMSNDYYSSEFKDRLKAESVAKNLQAELERANAFIQFQHEEFAGKVKELEETRKKLQGLIGETKRNSLSSSTATLSKTLSKPPTPKSKSLK
jgi:predicted RNase H-like nuclease (RuvC/YqgF family)